MCLLDCVSSSCVLGTITNLFARRGYMGFVSWPLDLQCKSCRFLNFFGSFVKFFVMFLLLWAYALIIF